MPDGSDQRRIVMHAAYKNSAEQHPQQRRQPAEGHSRDNGADDRAGAGDAGKMVPEQYKTVGRNPIHSIVIAVAGSRPIIADIEPFFQKTAVKNKGERQEER
ncbi:MAG: hypothetical protein BWY83_01869 [bacterium ADurb.Bin478]|nr:MAG: hypothetical protein BWY83_01869 [bacterium ADurb.Bin478]